MKTKRNMVLLGFAVCFLGISVSTANAAGRADGDFPSRSVEVTVVFGAGSAADNIARKFSDLIAQELGRPFPVVNRTGGGQAIGFNHVRNQRPDGYNMIWTSNGLLTAYYQGNLDFRYDAFRHIARVSYEPVSIAVRADAPWRTMEELFNYIRNNPGTVRIGNSGVGTFTHLVAAAIENEANSSVIHVPFGAGMAFASLLGGVIEASIQLPSEVMAQYEAGQLRFLAISSGDRIASIPHIPTLKESNINLEMILWRGLAVPMGTPESVVRILENAARNVVASSEFHEFSEVMGIIPAFMPQEEFERFISEDDRLTGELMRTIGTSVR
ncbi:MAG: tripartite tricarboxylate transporter substrate binding protein [Treponema sp.]|nr:tripartite tricarboxylate transporter substrate binding protein [Treponema sp.]